MFTRAPVEAGFLDCSYGFRPGRNPHNALQALRLQTVSKKVNHVFEADIRSYFTRISHQWLRKIVAHRIADPAILKLIGKWLKAGAMVDGALISTEEGTPQGGPISPVLSNIYLHFTLDLWFEKKFKAQCQGEAYLVVSRVILWEASSSEETRRTFSANCGTLRNPIWNWPRRKLGCCSLGVLPPSNGASTDRGQRRLSFWASSTSVGRIEQGGSP